MNTSQALSTSELQALTMMCVGWCVFDAAAGGGSNGTFTDVLFFPDPAMPCHYMGNCRRHNCTYAHTQTNLTK
jgi:hypothetical protein